jgi:hypothetical protein
MKKLRLLLLDANIVFKLFSADLWGQVLEKCDVLLSRVVAEVEVKYFDDGVEHQRIDLQPYLRDKRISIVDIDVGKIKTFKSKFDTSYLERLDDGEAESLTYLDTSSEPCLICSADAIVFKTLGLLGKPDQGLSLEEVLGIIGFGRKLEWQYSKAFRDRYTREGQADLIQGNGLSRKK